MSDDAKEKLVKRMDSVADALLAIVMKEETSEVQKGRLFTSVQSWMKLRQSLQPSGEGEALKGMTNAINSKGDKRSGSAGRGNSDSRTAAHGKAIAKIIRNLPKPATSVKDSGHAESDRGNQEDTEREGGGGDGDGGIVRINGSGDVAGNINGLGNSNLV